MGGIVLRWRVLTLGLRGSIVTRWEQELEKVVHDGVKSGRVLSIPVLYHWLLRIQTKQEEVKQADKKKEGGFLCWQN